MNESKNMPGIAGVFTTTCSFVVALLPTINLIVQICAGLTAIVVGILTARYYIKKTRMLK